MPAIKTSRTKLPANDPFLVSQTTHKKETRVSLTETRLTNAASPGRRSKNVYKNICNGNHAFKYLEIAKPSGRDGDDEEEVGIDVEHVTNGDYSVLNISSNPDVANRFLDWQDSLRKV